MQAIKRLLGVMAAVCVLFGGNVLPVLGAEGEPAWIMEIEAGEDAQALVEAADAEQWAQSTAAEASEVKVGGKGSILMDLDSGTVLLEQNADAPVPIASVTKIMTMLLIFEALDSGALTLQDEITCSEVAASYGGSQIWLEPNETMCVEDLLKAIAVVSANDACAMLAEHLAGTTEAFVAKMNARAAELGMKNTKFSDCCGLDDSTLSTARDVALMSRELMKHKAVQNYTTIWMDTLRGGDSQLVNTNKLVRFYKGATGLKTGTTAAAGHCLSGTAERDGMRLCAVILGCKTTDERFGGVRAMLDYGFSQYALYTPSASAEQLMPVPVLHGTASTVECTPPAAAKLLLKKGEETRVKCAVSLAKDVEAPVVKGQKIGTLTVTLDGKTLATYPVTAAQEVPRMSIKIALRWLWKALL